MAALERTRRFSGSMWTTARDAAMSTPRRAAGAFRRTRLDHARRSDTVAAWRSEPPDGRHTLSTALLRGTGGPGPITTGSPPYAFSAHRESRHGAAR
jgi:hypothetical protein